MSIQVESPVLAYLEEGTVFCSECWEHEVRASRNPDKYARGLTDPDDLDAHDGFTRCAACRCALHPEDVR